MGGPPTEGDVCEGDTRVAVGLYDLSIEVEELNDGSDYRYVATSPDLPNLIVVGDTIGEVLELAPRMAEALIASMRAAGDSLSEH